MMTQEEKIKIKAKLPTKWVAALVDSTGFSEPYVRKVMAGGASHIKIEKAALELAKKYQQEIKEVEQLKEAIL